MHILVEILVALPVAALAVLSLFSLDWEDNDSNTGSPEPVKTPPDRTLRPVF